MVQRQFVIAIVMDIIVRYAIAIVISHDNDICTLMIFYNYVKINELYYSISNLFSSE